MRLDESKIEERIEKLQQLQKLASDPELLRMLLEFLEMDEKPAKAEANGAVSHPMKQANWSAG